ncbi:MAG: hypothetical protein KCHDKBKB_01644 [Elusimicrobia bacterium]|nr:hypothetical protein [Elusimicrobiota bacterium]
MKDQSFQLLLLVFRSGFSKEILEILDALKLPGYTEAPTVFGRGTDEPVFESHAWPGHNSLVLSALSKEDVARVVAALTDFTNKREKEGEHVPLRVYSIPCTQLV